MELDKKKELRADLMLLVVAMCWGFSYLGMKVAIKEVPTFALNTYRFLGAFAVAVALSFNRVKKINKITLPGFMRGFFAYLKGNVLTSLDRKSVV